MKNENIRLRIPYFGAGLVILTTLILTFIIIPGIVVNKTPGVAHEGAVIAIAVVIILHLLIVYAFREVIIVNKRGVRLKKIVFIITGIGLLLLGLVISDGAFAFSGHTNMQFVAISMFICVASDVVAGVLAFISLFLLPKKVDIK